MKKTPWYPIHIKPVRKGWYNTDSFGKPSKHMRRWNGDAWVDFDNGQGIVRVKQHFQDFKWRGLKNEPR